MFGPFGIPLAGPMGPGMPPQAAQAPRPPMLGGPQMQNPNNPGTPPNAPLPNPGNNPLATLNHVAPPMLGMPQPAARPPMGQSGGLPAVINHFASPGGLQSLFGR